MESEYARVTVKGHQFVDGVKTAQTCLGTRTAIVGNKDVSYSAELKSNSSVSKLGKRNRQCEVSCCPRKTTSPLKNYENFKKSGLLSRLLSYHDGEWVDFPREVTELVKKKFQLKYAVVEVELEGSQLIVDVMYMRLVDLKTGLQKPIAWIDDAGSCFFPEVFTADGDMCWKCKSKSVEKSSSQDIRLHIQIDLNGENIDEVSKTGKKLRVETSADDYLSYRSSNDNHNDTEVDDSGSENEGCDDRTNRSLARVDKENQKFGYSRDVVDCKEVSEMFVTGMLDISIDNIVEVKGCSGEHLRDRLEAFEKQIELTQKYRGSANVQYAWLPCMTNGVGFGVLPRRSAYGHGVHLSSASYAYNSVNYCDDDENGVRHMLLCRVILGNVELVHPGSKQLGPSSDQYDTGVDNLQDPQFYVVWEVNSLTHIHPEYVVSFKLLSRPEGAYGARVRSSDLSVVTTNQDCPAQFQFGLANPSGLSYHPGKNFKSENQGYRYTLDSSTPRAPKSPWMPFPLLFEAIAKLVPQKNMQVVYHHYNLFKCKKSISRSEFIRRLRIAVGDAVLKSTITSLQCKQPTVSPSSASLKAPNPEPEV